MKTPAIAKLAACAGLLTLTGACSGIHTYTVSGTINVTYECSAVPRPTSADTRIALENSAARLSITTNLTVNAPFSVTLDWPDRYGEPKTWKIESVGIVCPSQCTLTNIPGPNRCLQQNPNPFPSTALTNELVLQIKCICDQ